MYRKAAALVLIFVASAAGGAIPALYTRFDARHESQAGTIIDAIGAVGAALAALILFMHVSARRTAAQTSGAGAVPDLTDTTVGLVRRFGDRHPVPLPSLRGTRVYRGVPDDSNTAEIPKVEAPPRDQPP